MSGGQIPSRPYSLNHIILFKVQMLYLNVARSKEMSPKEWEFAFGLNTKEIRWRLTTGNVPRMERGRMIESLVRRWFLTESPHRPQKWVPNIYTVAPVSTPSKPRENKGEDEDEDRSPLEILKPDEARSKMRPIRRGKPLYFTRLKYAKEYANFLGGKYTVFEVTG